MDEDIRELTERFIARLTSVEEEETLVEYFRSHDVSGEWKAYNIDVCLVRQRHAFRRRKTCAKDWKDNKNRGYKLNCVSEGNK